MCSRTRPLSDPRARADLTYFELFAQGARSPGLSTGVVFDATPMLASDSLRPPPMRNVRITATPEAGGAALTTRTRDDGSFELTGVPAGTLRIVADLPGHFAAPAPVTVRMPSNGECTEGDIFARVDGRVRGLLLDEARRPGRGVKLHLADAERARNTPPLYRTIDAVTDEEGVFEFRLVGPGRYVVGVGLHDAWRPGQLDRRRFHTQARSPDAATIVELQPGEHVQLTPFTLAPLPLERTITIVVTAPSLDVARSTRLFLTGATQEPLVHDGSPLVLRLPGVVKVGDTWFASTYAGVFRSDDLVRWTECSSGLSAGSVFSIAATSTGSGCRTGFCDVPLNRWLPLLVASRRRSELSTDEHVGWRSGRLALQ